MNNLYYVKAETEEGSNWDMFVWAESPDNAAAIWAKAWDPAEVPARAWDECGEHVRLVLDGSALREPAGTGVVSWESLTYTDAEEIKL